MSEWMLWFVAIWLAVMAMIWAVNSWLNAVLRWYNADPFRPEPIYVRLFAWLDDKVLTR